MNEPLVVIVGPTAVGKTKLSLEIAKTFNGEVINGDSMQVYQDLSIGTAKITEAEMSGIPHHLIDFLPPTAPYTAADFQNDVRQLVPAITGRGHVPVLVGGTGLYVKAATHNYEFGETKEDPNYRKHLEVIADKEGPIAFHRRLKDVDPESAANIHPNNVQRVIRALEVFHLTGKRKSERQPDHSPEPVYNIIVIGLTMDRELLYDRINNRVDEMVDAGLVEEAYSLYQRGVRDVQAVQAIGYKELYQYFDGEISRQEAINLIKKNSRRFAKRQFTWFNNQMTIHWFDMSEAIHDFQKKADEIVDFVAGNLK